MAFHHPAAAAVKVVRRSSVLVAPSRPTPRYVAVLPLPHADLRTLLDRRDRMYTFHARSFAADAQGLRVCDVLRPALEKTLVAYYPFAGRARLSSHGALQLICNARGVVFVEAHANTALPALSRLNHSSPACLRHNAMASFTDVPPLVVQVTELLCGSFVLTLGVLEVLSDVSSTLQFIKEWMETAQVDGGVSIVPVYAQKEEKQEGVLMLPPHPKAIPSQRQEMLVGKRAGDVKIYKDAAGVATSLMAGERMAAEKKGKEKEEVSVKHVGLQDLKADKQKESARKATEYASVATIVVAGERTGVATSEKKEEEKEIAFKSQILKQEELMEKKEYRKLAEDAIGLATSLIAGEGISTIAAAREKEKEMSLKHIGAAELKAYKKEEMGGKKAEYVKLAKEAVGVASLIIGEKIGEALAEKGKEEKIIKQTESVGKKMEYMDVSRDAVGVAASLIIGEKMGEALAEKEKGREKKEEQVAIKYQKQEELLGKKMDATDLKKDGLGEAASLMIGEKMDAGVTVKGKEKEEVILKYQKQEAAVGKKMDYMDLAKDAVGVAASLIKGEKMHAGVIEKGKAKEQVVLKYEKHEELVGKKMDYMDLAKDAVGVAASLMLGEKMVSGVTEKGKEEQQAAIKYQKQEEAVGKEADYMDLVKNAVGVATSLMLGEKMHTKEEPVSLKYQKKEQSGAIKDAVGLAASLVVEERMHGASEAAKAIVMSDESERRRTASVMIDIPIEWVVSLKQQLAAEGMSKFTAFEALAAHLWRERTSVLRMPMLQEVKLYFPSDEGDGMGGVSASGFECKAVASAGDLVRRPLSYGVELIQAAKKRAVREAGLPVASKDPGTLFLTELSKMRGASGGGVGVAWDESGRKTVDVAGLARKALDYDFVYVVMSNVPVSLVEDLKARIRGRTVSKL